MESVSVIPRIKEAVDLTVLVSEYIKLRNIGPASIGLCCFHDERTPSFRVNHSGQYFFCFGCGAKGDAIDFMARTWNVGKGAAIKMLSERTGIPLDGTKPTRAARAYDRQEKEFAEWWRADRITSLEKQLTGCVRWGTGEEAERRGGVLRQLRALNGAELRALVLRCATDADRLEYDWQRADAEWVGLFMVEGLCLCL